MNWLKWIKHTRKMVTYFRENQELIKSIVLTALIALSLVLTWSLWTFKPSYSVLEDPRTVKKQVVDVDDQTGLSEVVYPTQIIYHKGKELYGLEAHEMISTFHDQLNEASFDFESGTPRAERFDPNEISMEDMKNNEYIEVIYPFGMSQEIYKEVFSFDIEISANKPQSVDRLFLYQNKSGVIEGYLVSYMTKKMQKIRPSNLPLNNMMKEINGTIKNGGFVPYMSYDIEERTEEGENEITNRFYLPKNPLELNRYGYISKAINDDTFDRYKRALFKDPLSVKSAKTESNEATFTDGTAALVINKLQNRFTYTNFAGLINDSTSTSTTSLFQSIDYINTHAGWGNPYIVSSLSNTSASFWMYVNYLPILDPDMEMSLLWEGNELQEYERSMIQLELDGKSYPATLTEKVTIRSGEKVIRELIDSDYNLTNIQDIRIGYTMKRQSEPHFYFLEPSWFINYENKGWVPLFKEDREEGF